jgi:capsular exopolysaccharide synthesis family protein
VSIHDADPSRAPAPTPTQALAFLWRGRWWIAVATTLFAALGLWYAQQRGTIWRVKSVLYVERDVAIMPGTEVSPWMHTQNYANTQAELLRSVPILHECLQKAGIDASPVFGDSNNHLMWLRHHLTVKVGVQDDLITVSLDSQRVQEACDIVNAVVDSYLQFHSRSKRETTREVLTNLNVELQRYEGELRTLQQEEKEFLTANPFVAANDATRIVAERYRDLYAALTRAEVEVLEAEASWRAVKSLAGSADLIRQLPIQGAGLLPTRAEQDGQQLLRELRQRHKQLLAEATPDHPGVQNLAKAIAELEQQAAVSDERFANAYLLWLEQRVQSTKQKHEELAAKVAAQELRIAAVDPAQAEYRELQNRIERTRRLADSLYDRVRSLGINLETNEGKELSALVYEPATPDGASVTSSKRVLVAIAILLGLLLGTGLAWFRSLIDQRMRTAEDVAKRLPLLATVPRITPDRRDVVQTWRSSPEFGESMRSLRTVIYFGARSERTKILQVASAQDREGKSLITAGLGIAMAQSGQRTLIVDGDLHQATQAKLFRAAGKIGLSQVLTRRAAAAAAIVDTPIANLRLLPAGPAVQRTDELLDGARLATVLQELAADYDRILIDSPPLLRVADARIIAAISDETVLVVRSGHTTRSLAEAAIAQVASVAGRISGAVLNWAPRIAGLGTSSAYPYSSGLAAPLADKPAEGTDAETPARSTR